MALDQIDVDALDQQEDQMSFLDHLEALRWHIIRAGMSIIIISLIVFMAKDFVFGTIVFGPTLNDFPTYTFFCKLSNWIGAGETLCMSVPKFNWITPIFGEKFIIHIQVSLVIGFIASFPYVFWEFWKFVRPGLLDSERKAASGTVFICSFLFILGVLFGYYIIAPFAVNFLISYELPGVQSAPALSSYISYLTLFTVPAGLVFELPVLVYFLARFGLITGELMKQYRRHAIVVLLVFSAVITPPDIITQVLLAMPLYVLYEISITIAERVEHNAKLKEEKETQEYYKSLKQ